MYRFSLAVATVLIGIFAHVANAAIVVDYQFNGNLLDSSGNNIHGVGFGSLSFVAGLEGNAIYFDNPIGLSPATMWVSVPNNAEIVSLSESSFSYALRVRSTDAAKTNGRLFGNSGPGAQRGVVLDYNAHGVDEAYHSVRGNYEVTSRDDVIGNADAVITDGEWHWVVVVVDRTHGVAKQYVDENLVSSRSLGPNIGIVSLENLSIGRDTGQPDYAARHTAVDEFILFDTALPSGHVPSVPEPSTYALWLSGVAMMASVNGRIARRRSQSTKESTKGVSIN